MNDHLLGTIAALLMSTLAIGACSSGDDIDRTALPSLESATSASTQSAGEQDSETGTDQEPELPEPLVGELTINVIAAHPHDPEAFTQGLELHDGRLIESTGLYGESDRRIVDVTTGRVEAVEALEDSLFGEGITVVGDEVLQLTWTAGVFIRSAVETLTETGRGTYDGEGWGLCFDGNRLVMSDGTSTLTFRDPASFDPIGTVTVTINGEPLANLNELECLNGQVLANVWLTDFVVVIDPTTGDVVGTLDASSLRPEDAPFEQSRFALNGIAHDPTTGRFFLTGKQWSVLYEVELS